MAKLTRVIATGLKVWDTINEAGSEYKITSISQAIYDELEQISVKTTPQPNPKPKHTQPVSYTHLTLPTKA